MNVAKEGRLDAFVSDGVHLGVEAIHDIGFGPVGSDVFGTPNALLDVAKEVGVALADVTPDVDGWVLHQAQ